MKIKTINTPISDTQVERLEAGDLIEIDGTIFTGRDAVLPQLVEQLKKGQFNGPDISGGVIFHTAVSQAGVGPTTSNKEEIEGNIPYLSKAGVKIHLGKGSLSRSTVKELDKYNAVFAITTPTTALFRDNIIRQDLVAFEKEGMEAMYKLKVKGFPALVAIAHGESIFEGD